MKFAGQFFLKKLPFGNGIIRVFKCERVSKIDLKPVHFQEFSCLFYILGNHLLSSHFFTNFIAACPSSSVSRTKYCPAGRFAKFSCTRFSPWMAW